MQFFCDTLCQIFADSLKRHRWWQFSVWSTSDLHQNDVLKLLAVLLRHRLITNNCRIHRSIILARYTGDLEGVVSGRRLSNTMISGLLCHTIGNARIPVITRVQHRPAYRLVCYVPKVTHCTPNLDINRPWLQVVSHDWGQDAGEPHVSPQQWIFTSS